MKDVYWKKNLKNTISVLIISFAQIFVASALAADYNVVVDCIRNPATAWMQITECKTVKQLNLELVSKMRPRSCDAK